MAHDQQIQEQSQTTIRNPEDPLEVAWARYASEFLNWQRLREMYQASSSLTGREADESKEAHRKANEALWDYFEAYDADQVIRFGPNEVVIKI